MNDIALFLPLYSAKKEKYVEAQNDISNNAFTVDLNMSWPEERLSELPIEHVGTLMDDENEIFASDISTSKSHYFRSVEKFKDFIRKKNNKNQVYKNKKSDCRIVSYYNAYRLVPRASRQCSWPKYISVRQSLALAGIIKGKVTSENTSSHIGIDSQDANSESDLSALTNENRSDYTITTVLETWSGSFEKRQQILVLKKNKKITIRYESYLNMFACLHSTFELELLQIDSYSVIEGLAGTNAIPKNLISKIIFKTRWTSLTPLICQHGDASQISCIKDFRKTHKDYLAEAPKPILALFYVACFLTKTYSVSTKEKGIFNFSRAECVEHFIKLVDNESEVANQKLGLKTVLNSLGLSAAPYIIICGKLNNNIKAKRSSDSMTTANVWLYLLEHVYSIRPNISYAFPPAKSTKTISTFIKKIDPSFSTA
ncbi:hypothetical protein TSAR_009036, partial [Trichomalopsis sarcophagae]